MKLNDTIILLGKEEAARFLETLGYIRNLAVHDLDKIILAKDLAENGVEPFASGVMELTGIGSGPGSLKRIHG